MGSRDRTAEWKHIPRSDCPHLALLDKHAASTKTACEACGETSDLRICLTCGYVGCCESDKAHDTAHFRATGHPFIRPHGCDYDWLWCYRCHAFLE